MDTFLTEAEGQVISAALQDFPFCFDLLDLSPDIFTVPAYRRLRTIMETLMDRGEKVSRASILAEAPGAQDTLDGLPARDPDGLQIVWRAWIKREARQVGTMLTTDQGDVDACVDAAREKLMSLSPRRIRRAKSVGALTSRLVDHPEESEPIFFSGIEAVDTLLDFVCPTDYVVIGARPSVGKSSLALQIAIEVASKGHGVLVFSLEMDEKLLGGKALTQLSGAPYHLYQSGHLGIQGQEAIRKAGEHLRTLPLAISDDPGVTVRDIRAEARRMQGKMPLSLVIVDYLQIVRPVKPYSNREREVSEISQSLKAMAKDLGVVALALAQVKRGSDDDEEITLDAFRESGAIEQDADMVIFLSRKRQEPRESATISVAKNRRGPTGSFKVEWNGIQGRFFDAGHNQDVS